MFIPCCSSKKIERLWQAATSQDTSPEGYTGIEFWSSPKLATLLTKTWQGEYIKTWRCHWFVLKQDKLFWFKDSHRTHSSMPNDVIPLVLANPEPMVIDNIHTSHISTLIGEDIIFLTVVDVVSPCSQIHDGGEKLKENRHSFLYRFPQTAPNVDAQNRRSWNNENSTVNLQESK
ncbi:hypothetical protein ACFX11_032567 [Malus domestica]